MHNSKFFLPLLLALTTLVSFTACKKDKEKTCEDRIQGEWKTSEIIADGADVTADNEIIIELNDGGKGEITITNPSGTDSYDIESWTVNSGCTSLDFTDEDSDEVDWTLESVGDDEFVAKGTLYNPNQQLEMTFKRR
jgi:hypothetical protein